MEASSSSILRQVMTVFLRVCSSGGGLAPQAASSFSAAARAAASCLTCDASGAVLEAPCREGHTRVTIHNLTNIH